MDNKELEIIPDTIQLHKISVLTLLESICDDERSSKYIEYPKFPKNYNIATLDIEKEFETRIRLQENKIVRLAQIESAKNSEDPNITLIYNEFNAVKQKIKSNIENLRKYLINIYKLSEDYNNKLSTKMESTELKKLQIKNELISIIDNIIALSDKNIEPKNIDIQKELDDFQNKLNAELKQKGLKSITLESDNFQDIKSLQDVIEDSINIKKKEKFNDEKRDISSKIEAITYNPLLSPYQQNNNIMDQGDKGQFNTKKGELIENIDKPFDSTRINSLNSDISRLISLSNNSFIDRFKFTTDYNNIDNFEQFPEYKRLKEKLDPKIFEKENKKQKTEYKKKYSNTLNELIKIGFITDSSELILPAEKTTEKDNQKYINDLESKKNKIETIIQINTAKRNEVKLGGDDFRKHIKVNLNKLLELDNIYYIDDLFDYEKSKYQHNKEIDKYKKLFKQRKNIVDAQTSIESIAKTCKLIEMDSGQNENNKFFRIYVNNIEKELKLNGYFNGKYYDNLDWNITTDDTNNGKKTKSKFEDYKGSVIYFYGKLMSHIIKYFNDRGTLIRLIEQKTCKKIQKKIKKIIKLKETDYSFDFVSKNKIYNIIIDTNYKLYKLIQDNNGTISSSNVIIKNNIYSAIIDFYYSQYRYILEKYKCFNVKLEELDFLNVLREHKILYIFSYIYQKFMYSLYWKNIDYETKLEFIKNIIIRRVFNPNIGVKGFNMTPHKKITDLYNTYIKTEPGELSEHNNIELYLLYLTHIMDSIDNMYIRRKKYINNVNSVDRYILILVNTNYLIDLFNNIKDDSDNEIVGGSKTTKTHILDSFIRVNNDDFSSLNKFMHNMKDGNSDTDIARGIVKITEFAGIPSTIKGSIDLARNSSKVELDEYIRNANKIMTGCKILLTLILSNHSRKYMKRFYFLQLVENFYNSNISEDSGAEKAPEVSPVNILDRILYIYRNYPEMKDYLKDNFNPLTFSETRGETKKQITINRKINFNVVNEYIKALQTQEIENGKLSVAEAELANAKRVVDAAGTELEKAAAAADTARQEAEAKVEEIATRHKAEAAKAAQTAAEAEAAEKKGKTTDDLSTKTAEASAASLNPRTAAEASAALSYLGGATAIKILNQKVQEKTKTLNEAKIKLEVAEKAKAVAEKAQTAAQREATAAAETVKTQIEEGKRTIQKLEGFYENKEIKFKIKYDTNVIGEGTIYPIKKLLDFNFKDLLDKEKEDKIINIVENINLGNVIFEITDGTYKGETFTVQEPIQGGGAKKIKTKTKNNTVKKLMGGVESVKDTIKEEISDLKKEQLNYKKSGVDVDGFNVYSRETLLQEEIAYVEAQQNFNQAKLKVDEEHEILITELNNIVPDLKNNIINAVKTAAASDKVAAEAAKEAKVEDKAAAAAAAEAAKAAKVAVEEVKNKAQDIAAEVAEAIVTAGDKEITVAEVTAEKIATEVQKKVSEALETAVKTTEPIATAVKTKVSDAVETKVKKAVETKLKNLQDLLGITLKSDLNLSELKEKIEKLSKDLKEIEKKDNVKIQNAIKAKADKAKVDEAAKAAADEAETAVKVIGEKKDTSEANMFNNYKTALKDYIKRKIDYEIKKQIADDAKLKRGSSKTGLAISLIQVDGIYGIKLANEDIILFTQDGVDYSNKLKIFSIPDRPYSIFNYYITSLINGANDVLPLFKKFMKYYFIISKRVQPQESNYKNLLKKLEEGGFEPTELYSQIQELFTTYPDSRTTTDKPGDTRIDTLYKIKLEFPIVEGYEVGTVPQINILKKVNSKTEFKNNDWFKTRIETITNRKEEEAKNIKNKKLGANKLKSLDLSYKYEGLVYKAWDKIKLDLQGELIGKTLNEVSLSELENVLLNTIRD